MGVDSNEVLRLTGGCIQISLKNAQVILPNGRELFVVPELNIGPGERVLIQGASGRGKTTLLHLLAGLFLPTSGVVEVNGQRFTSLSDDARCELRRENYGIVFQKLNLLEHLTAAENVELALSAKVSPDSRAQVVSQALAAVQMSEHSEDRAATLSLGEQQRVAVARVLAARPAVILADEPTSSLDDKNADFVMKALFAAAEPHNGSSPALVVVSHDARVKKLFTRVIDFGEWAR
jgi:putative ABC transport system ATP-binding protein